MKNKTNAIMNAIKNERLIETLPGLDIIHYTVDFSKGIGQDDAPMWYQDECRTGDIYLNGKDGFDIKNNEQIYSGNVGDWIYKGKDGLHIVKNEFIDNVRKCVKRMNTIELLQRD